MSSFEKQVPMSGDLIKEKAVIIFKALYPIEEFGLKFSNSWLELGRSGIEVRSTSNMESLEMEIF